MGKSAIIRNMQHDRERNDWNSNTANEEKLFSVDKTTGDIKTEDGLNFDGCNDFQQEAETVQDSFH